MSGILFYSKQFLIGLFVFIYIAYWYSDDHEMEVTSERYTFTLV